MQIKDLVIYMLIDVLTAFAVVVSVGLIFGILLSVAVHLFAIDENEKTKKIRDALPGINCGACGFKGCNDYAKALSDEKTKPNLCIPGGTLTSNTIGEILGVEVENPKDVVAFVHCNGTCDVTSVKAMYEGIATCKAQNMIYGGPKSCSYGCLGCGDCADVCVSNAISVINGVARVDASRCVGCGMCRKECPKKIISMIPQETATVVYCSSKDRGADARKACKNACIGCKKCEKVCPEAAIAVINNCAVIDYTKCTGCGICAENCPAGCIMNVKFPALSEDLRLVWWKK